jgi:hypothetical protein
MGWQLAYSRTFCKSSRRQPINQRWHRMVRQMVEELCHRVDSLFARRTARDNARSEYPFLMANNASV